MLLKVGELAKRCGLTVRTLHHYDDIGLLKPSARSESGYRLYTRQDIARLHQVQALQRLGLSLSAIGSVLTNPGTHLPDLITQQLQMLTQQIEQATRLRDRLSNLQQKLQHGDEPDLSEWLTTLELMSMTDKYFGKYFTPEELKRLPANLADQNTNPEWAALVQHVNQLINDQVPTSDPVAREAARNWFTIVEREIVGDPMLLAKFSDMHAKEPEIQRRSGVTPAMVEYIQQASVHDKLDLYKKYLSAEEYAFVEANFGQHITEWPPLIADAYQALQSGDSATSAATLVIARRWIALSCAMYGPDPATSLKIRTAHEHEPDLLKGSLISPELLTYMRQAFAALHPKS